MRRIAAYALTALALASVLPTLSHAQQRRPQGQQQGQGQESDEQRRRRQSEWNQTAPPLPALRNAGPCPYVKILYDAARMVEFTGTQQASSAVTYTGEIQGVNAACEYRDDQPIRVRVNMLFSMGRGPAASGNQRNYRYWVAVTQRNRSVLAKEYFDIPVTFPAGADRVNVEESLQEIVIPRANLQVSGANFEVLIGFDVTPEQAAFNREGRRFHINAGQTQAAAQNTPGR